MSNSFYNYSGNFIAGTLARAEAVSAEFSAVAQGFARLSTQGVDTGTVNHVIFSTTGYPVAAYNDGNNLQFKVLFTNTGPTDINVNSIGAVPLLRFNGTPLVAGDLSAGSWYIAIYEAAFGGFTILSPAAYATFAGSISLAAPSHKVGLVAAAGSSTAAAPIDVTFAIDQSMSPTWTGNHNFTAAAGTPVIITSGVSATTLQLVNSGNAVGLMLTVPAGTGNTAVAQILSSDATARSAIVFGNPGGIARIGTDGTQVLLSDSANGDLCLVSAGQSVRIGTTNGGTTALKVTTGVQIGSPAGGDKGAGALNCTGFYINGAPVYSGIPQNSQSANYTTVLADANKHIYHPSADTTARTWTIDSNANVAYPVGTAITFDNDTSAGVITLAITSDTLVWLPSGTTGSRAIAAGGQGTALKVTATRWHLTGVGIT